MRRDVLWAVVAIVALVAVSATLGYRLGRGHDQSAAWRERAATLAASDSLQALVERLEARTTVLNRSRDSLHQLAARKQARLDTLTKQTQHLVARVHASEDSLTRIGATQVPIETYREALHALDVQDAELIEQRDLIHALRQEVRAGAQLLIVEREITETERYRAERAEAALEGLRPPAPPRWLGLVTPPSRTAVFLAGVAVTLLVSR